MPKVFSSALPPSAFLSWSAAFDWLQPAQVTMRQKSSTPKTRRDNRLSYIDNEIKVGKKWNFAFLTRRLIKQIQVLDAEQLEVDKQLSILERRLNLEKSKIYFYFLKVEGDIRRRHPCL